MGQTCLYFIGSLLGACDLRPMKLVQNACGQKYEALCKFMYHVTLCDMKTNQIVKFMGATLSKSVGAFCRFM